MSVKKQRILVIKPSSLGDIIHGLQVINSIRLHQPNTHITWVVADAFAPIVQACSAVDEVFIFERKGGARALWRLLRAIRNSGRYDDVLDLQGLARSGLMTWAAKSNRKIGHTDAREGAGFFYDIKVPLPPFETAHAVEVLSQFLPALGLPAEIKSGLYFDLPIPEIALPSPLERAVLIFPESRREEKNWPYFAECIHALRKSHPEQSFVWCGSPASAANCPAGAKIYNAAGSTSLLDAIALIQRAGAVIANDSGPIHIAAAVGTPVLALFGPTPIEAYGPYPRGVKGHHALRSEDGLMASLSVDRVCQHFESDLLPLFDC